MDLGIKGKLALVTGAGRGLGEGICHSLAQEGVRILATSRTSADLERLVQELGGASAGHIALPLDIAAADYDKVFSEHQVPHSTALHSLLNGHPYMVGPLARVNLNHDRLPAEVLEPLRGTAVRFPSGNPYHSLVARCVEVHYALWEAARILDAYGMPGSPFAGAEPRAGIGFGCTEAPRGLLWHRYETDANGIVTAARIVPPTSQNQARIEQDLKESLAAYGLEHDDDEIRFQGERVIRNYDPCISCSTHFLKLKVHRQ